MYRFRFISCQGLTEPWHLTVKLYKTWIQKLNDYYKMLKERYAFIHREGAWHLCTSGISIWGEINTVFPKGEEFVWLLLWPLRGFLSVRPAVIWPGGEFQHWAWATRLSCGLSVHLRWTSVCPVNMCSCILVCTICVCRHLLRQW